MLGVHCLERNVGRSGVMSTSRKSRPIGVRGRDIVQCNLPRSLLPIR